MLFEFAMRVSTFLSWSSLPFLDFFCPGFFFKAGASEGGVGCLVTGTGSTFLPGIFDPSLSLMTCSSRTGFCFFSFFFLSLTLEVSTTFNGTGTTCSSSTAKASDNLKSRGTLSESDSWKFPFCISFFLFFSFLPSFYPFWQE